MTNARTVARGVPRLAMVSTVALVAALSGCGGGAGKPPVKAAVVSGTASATTSEPVDIAAQSNCREFELTYSPVAIAIRQNAADLAVAGLVTQQVLTTLPSSSVAGAQAAEALTKMALQAALLRYDYASQQPINRQSFLDSWALAKSACMDVGYHFTL